MTLQDGDYFDDEAADRAVRFIETLCGFTQGKRGPFILEDFQRDDIIRPLFGWKRADARASSGPATSSSAQERQEQPGRSHRSPAAPGRPRGGRSNRQRSRLQGPGAHRLQHRPRHGPSQPSPQRCVQAPAQRNPPRRELLQEHQRGGWDRSRLEPARAHLRRAARHEDRRAVGDLDDLGRSSTAASGRGHHDGGPRPQQHLPTGPRLRRASARRHRHRPDLPAHHLRGQLRGRLDRPEDLGEGQPGARHHRQARLLRGAGSARLRTRPPWSTRSSACTSTSGRARRRRG